MSETNDDRTDLENLPPDEQDATEKEVEALLIALFSSMGDMDAKATLACMSPNFIKRSVTDENVTKYRKIFDYGLHPSAIHVHLMHIIDDDTIDCIVSCDMYSNGQKPYKARHTRKYDIYLTLKDGQWLIDNIVFLKVTALRD